jgi:hypothetical protein
MIVGWRIGLIRVLAQPQAQAQGNVTVIYDKLSSYGFLFFMELQ